MHLPTCLAVLVLSYVTSGSVDFESLRGITHTTHDYSRIRKGSPEKYFHESKFNPHYDGRFADQVLPHDQQLPRLQALIQTYLSTMHDLSIPTWIMHGSLLGWWWNRAIMPWDSDIDVQLSEHSMQFLAAYYNMSMHTFKRPSSTGAHEARSYLLEINPHFVNASVDDTDNAIDARWIDTHSGLFIDITVVHPNRSAPGNMYCKDMHQFLEDDIFPLRNSVFEGMPVKIPYAYSQLLEEEYGPRALTETYFRGYEFQPHRMEWVLVKAYVDDDDD